MEEKPPELREVWKRVVVIGGGVAGSLAAKALQFHADVTLIDPKDYFEIPWTSPRSMVEPSFARKSIVHHKDYLTNGRLVVSKAINISSSEVLTADGRQIVYDYLVIATGHDDKYPVTKANRLEEYRAVHEQIKSANSILIAGGGPAGVELAAEIAVDFSHVEVTLVHEGFRLLEFIGPKAAGKALHWLQSKRVEVKLRQSIDLKICSEGTKAYVTSSGETIKADCLFLCTGKPVGSDWLKASVLKDSIDGFGRLTVDENLRVKGCKNVFAVGDIVDVQGNSAQKQAVMAAKNVKQLLGGRNEEKMASYKPRSPRVFVSLGRHDAVAEFRSKAFVGLVPGLIKSKDLFVGKTRKRLGIHRHVVDY